MSKQTVLQLTGMTSNKYGALERYFVELVKYCNEKGFSSIFQYDAIPQSSDYLLHLENLGAKVVALNTHGSLLRSVLGIASLIHSIRPEVIQSHFVNDMIYFAIPIFARLYGVRKTISVVHSMPNMRRNSIRRFAYNNYLHVLPVSEAVAQNLVEGGVNPRIVNKHYLGLFGKREPSKQVRSQLRNEFGISDEAVVLGCIAFDTPFKGLDVLLCALSRVVQKGASAHLILIGVDPHKSSLPDQAAQLGLSNNVHWAGIRDDGWQILNAADVYVQSSRFGEGLSLAIMEAMALKLPVIATRVAGQQEAVIEGKTGYLTEPDNVDSLTRTLERLLSEPNKWRSMGKAGHERYLHLFRGENSIRTLVEKYFEV